LLQTPLTPQELTTDSLQVINELNAESCKYLSVREMKRQARQTVLSKHQSTPQY
jgi:hypothetical protein